MEKFIHIQDSDSFTDLLRQIVREEIGIILNSIHNPPDKGERVLTRAEVMKLFNISSATLWKRMSEGSMPYFKLGRKVFFKEREIMKFQDSGE